ncbi:hypothetical protein B296_00030739 [Ensete ventricosum]|uniref:Uncharacterized protein n=1 Tax=Ensete ventricosum TaxID=4639 RepID=A0A427A2H3_ENSVE|nr:hypothetical protein B296_00030739 [Ensete ventricosum]
MDCLPIQAVWLPYVEAVGRLVWASCLHKRSTMDWLPCTSGWSWAAAGGWLALHIRMATLHERLVMGCRSWLATYLTGPRLPTQAA